MRADGKWTVERMAGKRDPPRNPMMRMLAGLVSVFMVVVIPVAFVCVEGWWRKLCVLSMFSFVFLFGRYALGGWKGAHHEGGRVEKLRNVEGTGKLDGMTGMRA